MKSKLKIIIPAIVAVIATVTAILCIKFSSGENADIKSMLTTAEKYLTEQNYEQAIAEFEKIIEIDPKNVDAYLGLAKSYEKTGNIPKAIEVLEEGLKQTGDERIKSELERLKGVTESETEAVTTTDEATTVIEKSIVSSEDETVSEAVTTVPETSEEPAVTTVPTEMTEEETTVTVQTTARETANEIVTATKSRETITFTVAPTQPEKKTVTAETTVNETEPKEIKTKETTTKETTTKETTTKETTTKETTTKQTESETATEKEDDRFITIKRKKYSTSLNELDLYDEGLDDDDIEELYKMTDLEKLYLGDNNLTDISVLSKVTTLTELCVYNNEISDISPLSDLTDLEHLCLYGTDVEDISDLYDLTNLEYLDLSDDDIKDLSVISNFTNLEYLGLNNVGITDISPLLNLKNLKYLYLYDNDLTAKDIQDLKKALPNCEIYYDEHLIEEESAEELEEDAEIFYKNTTTITYTTTYSKYNVLQFSDKELTDSGLKDVIENLDRYYNSFSGTKYDGLMLDGNKISDISSLSGLTGFTFLDLSDNRISDISALSRLTKLKHLDLSDNQISDISVLSKLTNLEVLYLTNNPISDSDIEALKEALPNCNIIY